VTLETVLESFPWISVQMLSMSLSAVIRAAFSSSEMAVTGPATAAAIVEAVAFIFVARVVRWLLMAGTATEVTFEADKVTVNFVSRALDSGE
jgi:hypothetical protein